MGRRPLAGAVLLDASAALGRDDGELSARLKQIEPVGGTFKKGLEQPARPQSNRSSSSG